MVRIRFPPAKSLRTFGPCASRDHPARAAQGSRRFILWLERAVRDEPGYCAGDLCRGSEQRRGGGEPQCCIDRLIEIALAQITGSSLEILAHSRGQFPDRRQQTKRQEQYRDQILSCQPVLRYNFSVHQPIHDPVCGNSSRNPRIGTTAQCEGRSSVGLGVPDAAPHAGLAGTPRPGAILHTSSVNKVSVARRTARSLAYPPAEAKAGSHRRGTSGRPRRPLPIIWWTGASCRAM